MTAPSTTDLPFGAPLDPIEFMVPGECVPWARTGGGKSGARFTPAKQRSYAGTIKLFCSNAMQGRPPIEGPIELSVTAVYPWPASWSARKRAGSNWKTSRADLSNVVKLLEDALNTVAWGDDAQIVACHAYKLYGDLPRLSVSIRPIAATATRYISAPLRIAEAAE